MITLNGFIILYLMICIYALIKVLLVSDPIIEWPYEVCRTFCATLGGMNV